MEMTGSHRVYIHLARGEGKMSLAREYIKKYQEAGYEVKFIKPKQTNQRGFTLAPAIIDVDILSPAQCERAERMLKEILKGEKHER